MSSRGACVADYGRAVLGTFSGGWSGGRAGRSPGTRSRPAGSSLGHLRPQTRRNRPLRLDFTTDFSA
jgi:hypothetical protein